MSSERTDITVEITCNPDVEFDLERFRTLARSICCKFGVLSAEVSIMLADDEVVRKVNVEFLNESHETDVISFDLSDDDDELVHFELVINVDEATRQAVARDHSVEAEIALYITHGLLHNLGFDDADEEEGIKMHRMEDEILNEAGFGTVYGG